MSGFRVASREFWSDIAERMPLCVKGRLSWAGVGTGRAVKVRRLWDGSPRQRVSGTHGGSVPPCGGESAGSASSTGGSYVGSGWPAVRLSRGGPCRGAAAEADRGGRRGGRCVHRHAGTEREEGGLPYS